MPTYEYYCERCTKDFEFVCKISEYRTERRCPVCGNYAQQLISAPSVWNDCPGWINDRLRESMQVEGEAPVSSRAEFRRYCDEKGIIVT